MIKEEAYSLLFKTRLAESDLWLTTVAAVEALACELYLNLAVAAAVATLLLARGAAAFLLSVGLNEAGSALEPKVAGIKLLRFSLVLTFLAAADTFKAAAGGSLEVAFLPLPITELTANTEYLERLAVSGLTGLAPVVLAPAPAYSFPLRRKKKNYV